MISKDTIEYLAGVMAILGVIVGAIYWFINWYVDRRKMAVSLREGKTILLHLRDKLVDLFIGYEKNYTAMNQLRIKFNTAYGNLDDNQKILLVQSWTSRRAALRGIIAAIHDALERTKESLQLLTPASSELVSNMDRLRDSVQAMLEPLRDIENVTPYDEWPTIDLAKLRQLVEIPSRTQDKRMNHV